MVLDPPTDSQITSSKSTVLGSVGIYRIKNQRMCVCVKCTLMEGKDTCFFSQNWISKCFTPGSTTTKPQERTRPSLYPAIQDPKSFCIAPNWHPMIYTNLLEGYKTLMLLSYFCAFTVSRSTFFFPDDSLGAFNMALLNETLPQLRPWMPCQGLGPAIHRTQDWQDQVAALHGREDTWHIWCWKHLNQSKSNIKPTISSSFVGSNHQVWGLIAMTHTIEHHLIPNLHCLASTEKRCADDVIWWTTPTPAHNPTKYPSCVRGY